MHIESGLLFVDARDTEMAAASYSRIEENYGSIAHLLAMRSYIMRKRRLPAVTLKEYGIYHLTRE